MKSMSPAAFVHAIRSCGLLDSPQLGALTDVGGDDPRPLARQLLHRGWLTPYQINQVLSGHAPELLLGSYLLLERLGEGGMGQVYKARHQNLGRTVALKVIRKERTADLVAVSRFRREIQAVSRLSHPNIVLALDADEVAGTVFFVMEYVEGTDLKEQVRRQGPLPVALACEYLRQAALGLDHMASNGLVHRDIKPSNLLVTHVAGAPPAGQVKILDLGLARFRMGQSASDGSGTLTVTGTLMGTPDFIAAEQAANPHGADIRADLYSLGCTFYFLLTGSVPFPGGTAVEKLFRHRGEEPKAIEELRPDVPAKVAGILRKLMAKNPEDRFQTPAELARRLRPFVRDAEPQPDSFVCTLPTSPQTADVTAHGEKVETSPESTPAPSRRLFLQKRTCWVSAAVLVAAAGVLLALLPSSGLPEAPAAPTVPAPERPNTAERRYIRRGTKNETILACLKANGFPTLEGTWHYIGPFEYWRHDHQSRGFKEAYPPEKEIDLAKSYPGKGNQTVAWKQFKDFKLGSIVDLRLFSDNDGSCVYLYHEFDAAAAASLPLSLGSDDTLTVWFNGQCLLAKETQRNCIPDQDHVTLAVTPGKNQLLLKVCNVNATWAAYVMPQLPVSLDRSFGSSLRRDFPGRAP
jgi:serine/threonine protein kinase